MSTNASSYIYRLKNKAVYPWSDMKWYNDGRHKKVTTIIFYVIIDTKERKLIFMGRPKGGKNLYHSKEEKLALVYIQAYLPNSDVFWPIRWWYKRFSIDKILRKMI